MNSQTFWLAKRGNEPDEYEDAYAVDSSRGRFAIADGATESSFVREWTQLLVEKFVELPVRWQRRWRDWLPPLQQCWIEDIGSRDLPWFSEGKVAQGAFATFLGLLVNSEGQQRWWAIAVGDSCLFQVRDDRLLTTFPLARSADFDIQPNLLGSRSPVDVVTTELERWRVGDYQMGDRFFLATDAIAHWFMKQYEEKQRPWQTIATVCQQSEDAFADWIESLRDERDIHNDDVTLVIIDV